MKSLLFTLVVPTVAVTFVYWPILDSLTATQRADALMLWSGVAIILHVYFKLKGTYRG